MVGNLTTFYFELMNPGDSDCASVTKLFRRAANAIDGLGEIYVHDLLLNEVTTGTGRLPSIMVYYSHDELPRRIHVAQLRDDGVGGDGENKIDAEHRFIADEGTRKWLAHDTGHSTALNNPFAETDLCSVPKLLRRIADLIDLLGEVHVDDMVLDFQEYVEASLPSITIYYCRLDHVDKRRRPGRKPIRARKDTVMDSDSHRAGQEEREQVTEYEEQTVRRFTLKDSKNQPGYLSRPRLLRQTADAIEDLGEIDVRDLVLHDQLTDGKWVSEHVSFVTVYYSRRESVGAVVDRHDDGDASYDALTATSKHRYVGDHIDPNMADDRSNHSFHLRNSPTEDGYCSVPKLLRRTADAVDALPKVEIDDLLLHTEMTPMGRVPTVAVYYSRPTQSDKKFRKEWKQLEQDHKRHAKKMRRKEDEKRRRKD